MDNSSAMDMELIKQLTSVAKQVSKGQYKRIDDLFELTKEKEYPKLVSELAEAFGMMIVQVEARELRLEGNIEELKKTNKLLKETQDNLIKAEKLKVLAEFVSGIVHEVKNPLVGILGAAELLIPAEKDEQRIKLLNIITGEGQRLQELIHSILSYAKKREEIQLEEIEINPFLESKFSIWLSQLVKANINLKKELADNLPKIKVDPQRLYQVSLNLVLNARDAMPKGGNIIVMTALRKETGKELIDIKFADTGEGIEEKNLKNIFLPLFTTKETGTGLGLSICKEIIEKMSGKITAESEVGRGTTFTISFPAA